MSRFRLVRRLKVWWWPRSPVARYYRWLRG
jgi:hypothetical protein